uniref:Uncharacterized protein n=1 Tax=Anguilla anguilla TaxID=7936 RepID=A0A0E9VB73_ANGAN
MQFRLDFALFKNPFFPSTTERTLRRNHTQTVSLPTTEREMTLIQQNTAINSHAFHGLERNAS